PRPWGRLWMSHPELKGTRNTPTGVGKTDSSRGVMDLASKHPHGRGEDEKSWINGNECWETPPRAWGRLYNDKASGK
ncbi:conserved hypothetical protein, partial [methanotrophic bacterial endosymbiont of Bathymodiolus sp.]